MPGKWLGNDSCKPHVKAPDAINWRYPSGEMTFTVCRGKIHHAIKNGKPSISMGHLYHGYVSHNQMVSLTLGQNNRIGCLSVFFFFAGFAKKNRVFLERSPLTLTPNISHTPILWFRICGFIPASTVVSLPQYLCARGPAFDLKDHGGGNRSVFMGHVVGIPNVYLFYHPQNGNSTIINQY